MRETRANGKQIFPGEDKKSSWKVFKVMLEQFLRFVHRARWKRDYAEREGEREREYARRNSEVVEKNDAEL